MNEINSIQQLMKALGMSDEDIKEMENTAKEKECDGNCAGCTGHGAPEVTSEDDALLDIYIPVYHEIEIKALKRIIEETGQIAETIEDPVKKQKYLHWHRNHLGHHFVNSQEDYEKLNAWFEAIGWIE